MVIVTPKNRRIYKFLRNGFAVFSFDVINSFGESDGEYENARLGLHTEELEDVVLWVQKQIKTLPINDFKL